MPMAAFGSRFPEIALKETRSMTLRGHAVLPDGEYGFLEFYCDETGCDCRRALFMVVSPDPSLPVWATINYGWESRDYYAKWMGDPKLTDEAYGASLEPLGRQSPFAAALLKLFVEVVADDAYVERLKRHYALFKSTTAGRPVTKTSKPSSRTTKKRRKR